jgi:hypothetical protein
MANSKSGIQETTRETVILMAMLRCRNPHILNTMPQLYERKILVTAEELMIMAQRLEQGDINLLVLD